MIDRGPSGKNLGCMAPIRRCAPLLAHTLSILNDYFNQLCNKRRIEEERTPPEKRLRAPRSVFLS